MTLCIRPADGHLYRRFDLEIAKDERCVTTISNITVPAQGFFWQKRI